MPPAARITDMHICPMINPGPVPHVGGPVVKDQPNVMTGIMPQARVSDMCVCVGPPDTIVRGSATVLVGKMPAARMGDNTSHGGVIIVGSPTVIIGDGGAGGGGGGGGAGGGAGGSGGPGGLAQPVTGGGRGGSPGGPMAAPAARRRSADFGESGAPTADKPCLAKAAKAGSPFVRVR